MNTNTETMSPEAQRIAIATACGWKEGESFLNPRHRPNESFIVKEL